MTLITFLDVVHVLDDEPVASIALRRPRSAWCLHNHSVRAVRLRRRGIGRCLYHLCNGVYNQCLLGMSFLDGPRIRSQVRLLFLLGEVCLTCVDSSVERVVEYLDLPQEPPAVIESSRPPAYWPSSSGPNKDALISVENLVIKYAPELPAVLHDVSFRIKAKERVGLLGRTGSGKSTLAMSLLRFVWIHIFSTTYAR